MFAAKMIELDEKLRHLHERIDDGEHEDITALMGELNALTEEYNLEQDAIRYRLKECKVPKIQALISIKDVKQAIRIMMQILEKLDEIYHALHDSINENEKE